MTKLLTPDEVRYLERMFQKGAIRFASRFSWSEEMAVMDLVPRLFTTLRAYQDAFKNLETMKGDVLCETKLQG